MYNRHSVRPDAELISASTMTESANLLCSSSRYMTRSISTGNALASANGTASGWVVGDSYRGSAVLDLDESKAAFDIDSDRIPKDRGRS